MIRILALLPAPRPVRSVGFTVVAAAAFGVVVAAAAALLGAAAIAAAKGLG